MNLDIVAVPTTCLWSDQRGSSVLVAKHPPDPRAYSAETHRSLWPLSKPDFLFLSVLYISSCFWK